MTSGIFEYIMPTNEYNSQNFPFINTNQSFSKLTRSIFDDKTNITITWNFTFVEKVANTTDGLYLRNTITNSRNMTILRFGGIPLSRSNRQFQFYAGKFPSNELPLLLDNTDITGCFDSTQFNSNISIWNISRIRNLSLLNLFANSTFNNSSINNLNISSITQLNSMFMANTTFNQPLNNWNTSNVGDMQYLFSGANSFNQDISNWNVSKVSNFSFTFNYATRFNQDISKWNVSNARIMQNMLDFTAMSVENYDKLLLGWSKLPTLVNGVIFGVNGLQYSSNGKTGRDILVNKFGWSIRGDSEVADINLSNNEILENQNINTLIGLLSISNNTNNIYTVNDTIHFRINGNELLSNFVFNYETVKEYKIVITATNSNNNTSINKNFTIKIKNNNDAITDIVLSNNILKFNDIENAFIGVLSSVSEDINETFTYTLENENDKFQIQNNQLLSKIIFNDYTKTTYTITVKTTNFKSRNKNKKF
jgi:surface protein